MRDTLWKAGVVLWRTPFQTSISPYCFRPWTAWGSWCSVSPAAAIQSSKAQSFAGITSHYDVHDVSAM